MLGASCRQQGVPSLLRHEELCHPAALSESGGQKMYCVYWRECMFAFVCRQQIALTNVA